MDSGNVASQEQGFSNQVEVDQIQPSPTSQPPNHFDVDSDPSQALRGLQPNQQRREVANNNASDAVSFQAGSIAVGTVYGYGGPAPQYPSPVPTQPFEFQPWDAPQPPTVQSSNLGFMGSGNVASQEQGFSNQVEVDQIQPSPTSQPPNHFDVDSDPSQALRGLQPNRQMQQVRQAANNNASDAISFQAASTAVGTVDGYGGSAPQYPPPVPTQPSEFQLWDAPQPPTPQPMFFPDYEFPQDSTDINSTTPFSYQTGQATNQYIDQGIAEYSVSDLQGTSQQFGMAATAPLDAQPFHVDGQSNVPPVLSHPSYPPQQIASASGQAIDETVGPISILHDAFYLVNLLLHRPSWHKKMFAL
jgi:hypothetical protein